MSSVGQPLAGWRILVYMARLLLLVVLRVMGRPILLLRNTQLLLLRRVRGCRVMLL